MKTTLAKSVLSALHEDYGKLNESSQTADDQYKERLAKCKTLLASIGKGLTEHAKKQSSDKRNWGYSGDLGKAIDDLEELNNWLG